MKKLKGQDHADIRNIFIDKKIIIILICFFLTCCKTATNEEGFDKIDLSVTYNNEVNTFQIANNGSAVVLIRRFGNSDNYYNVIFNEEEMSHIQKELLVTKSSQCDTIKQIKFDGTRYIMYLTKGKSSKEIISGTCEELKPINKLVKYIVEQFNKKEKLTIFKSLQTITPPPPPPLK